MGLRIRFSLRKKKSFEYTPEEQKIIDKCKQYIGTSSPPIPAIRVRKLDKAYIPNEIKDRCSIEFNDIVPDTIKEKFLLYLHKKGIHDLKGWNDLITKEGKTKIADEVLDVVKDDPEFSKWSVNAFFKDTLELCLRKNDGSLKNWVVDEAIKQSILDE